MAGLVRLVGCATVYFLVFVWVLMSLSKRSFCFSICAEIFSRSSLVRLASPSLVPGAPLGM